MNTRKNSNESVTRLIRLAGAAMVYSAASTANAQAGACSDCFDVQFSIDIGSDRELSDPFTPGNNLMDPGDVYSWFRPLMASPQDGSVLDDMMIFAGFDPAPDDDIAGSIAPICLGGPIQQFAFEFFDLDGVDRISVDLRLLINPDGPNGMPIPQFGAPCIYDLKHLIISFDDDRALNWLNCDVPVNSFSPMGALYGMAATDDEVIAIDIDPFFGAVLSFTPWLDERDLNVNLSATPGFNTQEFDDDTDALDINIRSADGIDECRESYFSADHEAHHLDAFGVPLDPGSIYYAVPGFGPVKVVDDMIHLGIPESADVDAFEFVWAPGINVGGPGPYLAVVFSVDDDDPATPGDESGGLSPGQLYLSYFGGFSIPLLINPLPDDVDAIAAYCGNPSDPAVFAPIKCDADANGDGIVNINDLNIILSQWGTSGPEGDLNDDGIVDVNDLNLVLASWGQNCRC